MHPKSEFLAPCRWRIRHYSRASDRTYWHCAVHDHYKVTLGEPDER